MTRTRLAMLAVAAGERTSFATAIAVLLFLIRGATLFGGEFTIVSPPVLEEGDTRGGVSSLPARTQYLHDAQNFASVPATHRWIVGVAWRPDETTPAGTGSTDNLIVRLSTTSVDQLDLSFAVNIGIDEAVVFTESWTTSTAAETNPRSFDYRLDFTRPFFYEPEEGNLLVDTKHNGFDLSAETWVDNQRFSDGRIRLIGTSGGGNPDSLTAEYSWDGLTILQFVFAPGGDTDRDSDVDIDDLNAVRNNFGATGPDDGTLPGDTLPWDGLVDVDDLNAVRNNFGAGTTAVPEPSGFALALLVALFTVTVRRRLAMSLPCSIGSSS